MTATAHKIAEQVMVLSPQEREEFLSWLADFEAGQNDGTGSVEWEFE